MARESDSSIKFEELYQRVESGKPEPLYFLSGEEEYLKIEFQKLLRQKMFGDSGSTANVEKIAATPGSAPKIIDLASDYSLFSGGRLVVVYDIQRISEKGRELLLSFLPTVPPGNVIVMFGPAAFDKRLKFYKYLTQKAVWSALTGLSERSAQFWIQKRLAANGLKITQPAVDMLLRYIGNSYGMLANQIDKLAIAASDKQTVDVDDVSAHTAASAEFDIFRLTDAVDKRDRAAALEILNSLLQRSDSVGSVLFMLGRYAYERYIIATNRNQMSNIELASVLKTSPNAVTVISRLIGDAVPDQYERAIDLVTEAEISVRFGQIAPEIVMEQLVIALTDSSVGNKRPVHMYR